MLPRLVLLGVACGLCSCTWLDHRSDSGLERELMERSAQGLALATFPDSATHLYFFDGRRTVLKRECCGPKAAISQNRIVQMDTTSFPGPYSTLTGFPDGFPLVEMDARGAFLRRSKMWFRGGAFALSPRGDRAAFAGVPHDQYDSGWGIYLMGFDDAIARKLTPVALTPPRPIKVGERVDNWGTTLDWSSDGRTLLFSDEGRVVTIDVNTGQSRKIAEGAFAQWSPAGDRISYVSLRREPMLLNPGTGESKLIDPGHGTGMPLKWSPDGKYLFIRESEGSQYPYGCSWVYRVADGAWLALTDVDSRSQWVQLPVGE